MQGWEKAINKLSVQKNERREGENSRRLKVARPIKGIYFRPIKRHWPCSSNPPVPRAGDWHILP